MVSLVLDMVPDAEEVLEELIPDSLIVPHGIRRAAPLDPPVPVLGRPVRAVREVGVGAEQVRPRRPLERHGLAHVAGGEEQRRAEPERVGFLGRPRLAELALRFAADAVLGAGQVANAAVARAVDDVVPAEAKPALRRDLDSRELLDAPDLAGPVRLEARLRGRLHAVDLAVQVEVQVRLRRDSLPENQVPHLAAALRVAGGVLKAEFLHNAGLPRVRPATGAVGAADVHLDLARRVPAQHRPVLNQRGPRAVARRGNGGADARQPASYDDDIVLLDSAGSLDGWHYGPPGGRVGLAGGVSRKRKRGPWRDLRTAATAPGYGVRRSCLGGSFFL